MTYTEWCKTKGVSHAHCPRDCWHPQPQVAENGDLICMRCAVLDGVRTVMIPCVPETCPDA